MIQNEPSQTRHPVTYLRRPTPVQGDLTNVDLLASLTTVEGDSYIRDNPALCQSLVDALVEAMTVLG
jgi:hypothetical protein